MLKISVITNSTIISQTTFFLYYVKNFSGYKLYNSITNNIVMSKDVKFNEQQIWDWKYNKQHKKVTDLEENIIQVSLCLNHHIDRLGDTIQKI